MHDSFITKFYINIGKKINLNLIKKHPLFIFIKKEEKLH